MRSASHRFEQIQSDRDRNLAGGEDFLGGSQATESALMTRQHFYGIQKSFEFI
jgi:hypothetical protein